MGYISECHYYTVGDGNIGTYGTNGISGTRVHCGINRTTECAGAGLARAVQLLAMLLRLGIPSLARPPVLPLRWLVLIVLL